MYVVDGVAYDCTIEQIIKYKYHFEYYDHHFMFIASNNLRKLKEDAKAKRMRYVLIHRNDDDYWISHPRKGAQMLAQSYGYCPRY